MKNETVNLAKLTAIGSFNLVVEVVKLPSGNYVPSYYCPRKYQANWAKPQPKEDVLRQVGETIERLKIAINNLQDFADGKTDVLTLPFVLENEPETCPNYHNNF